MKKIILIVFVLLSFSLFSSAQIINTFAGNGAWSGYDTVGNGGPATAAQIDPSFMCLDLYGNIYICESYDLRKINASGVITAFAGGGAHHYGFGGDGGSATAALINNAKGIAIDAAGNIYIADNYNYRIRKVNTSGVITTVAGNGMGGFGGDGGPATNAKIDRPWAVAIDNKRQVYIVSPLSNRIRRVDTAGIIATIAGNGTGSHTGDGGPATAATIWSPSQIHVDASGNIYFVENGERIRKIDTGGIITTIAGNGTSGYSGDGGPATAAEIDPGGMSTDSSGNLYFAGDSCHVRKIDVSGIITTIAGTSRGFSGDGGLATAAQLNTPYSALAVNGGAICVADLNNYRIRIVSGSNRAPHFLSRSNTITVCSGTADSINTLLSIIDSDYWQAEVWNIVSAPLHGAAAVADTIGANGHIITPVGLYYTAASGYTGADSFRVRITDGQSSDTATVHVTVTALPSAITGSGGLCTGQSAALSDTLSGGAWSSSSTGVATVGSLSGTVSGLSAGLATITYTLPGGCYAVKAVTVNAAPAAVGGTTSVCVGASTPLSDATGGGVWSSGAAGIATVGSSGIVTGISAGVAAISYTLAGGCAAATTVTVGALPLAGTISGGSIVYTGSTLTLTSTVAGGAWSSSNGTATIGSASGVLTGVSAGADTVSYTVTNGCGTASASVSVTVTATLSCTPPAVYAITGGGVYCAGGAAVHIGLANSQPGVSYQLYRGGVSTGSAVAGTGSAISFGTFTAAGAYTAVANPGSACPAAMSGAAVITVNTTPDILPAPVAVSGGGSFCAGSAGVAVWLPGSGVGCNYQLYRNGIAVGSALAGVGSALSFGLQAVPGSYTVVSTSALTGCSTNMIGSANATEYPVPDIYSVTGGGTYCSGGAGITAGLSGSQAGVSYQLRNGSVTVGGPRPGTGSAISFGYVTAAGAYTVVGTSATCSSTMRGTATVSVTPLPTISGSTFFVAPAGSITLAGAPSGGIWSSSTGSVATVGSSSGIVSGVSAGSAVITYLVAGCSAAHTVYVTATGHRPGNNSGSNMDNIMVIPNPNHGIFTVKGTTGNIPGESVTIEVTNMLGQIICTRQANKQDNEFNTEIEIPGRVANGMYILSVTSGSERRFFHMVVE